MAMEPWLGIDHLRFGIIGAPVSAILMVVVSLMTKEPNSVGTLSRHSLTASIRVGEKTFALPSSKVTIEILSCCSKFAGLLLINKKSKKFTYIIY